MTDTADRQAKQTGAGCAKTKGAEAFGSGIA